MLRRTCYSGWRRMVWIGMQAACAVSLTLALAGPVGADDKVRYDDAGRQIVVTEDPTATPIWKQRLFDLAMEARRGDLSEAEAAEYNGILDRIGVAGTSAQRLTASGQAAATDQGTSAMAVA